MAKEAKEKNLSRYCFFFGSEVRNHVVAELADGFEHDFLGDGAHLDHAHDLVAAHVFEFAHVADGVLVVGGFDEVRPAHLAKPAV